PACTCAAVVVSLREGECLTSARKKRGRDVICRGDEGPIEKIGPYNAGRSRGKIGPTRANRRQGEHSVHRRAAAARKVELDEPTFVTAGEWLAKWRRAALRLRLGASRTSQGPASLKSRRVLQMRKSPKRRRPQIRKKRRFCADRA